MKLSARRIRTACSLVAYVLGDETRNYVSQGLLPRAMYTAPVHGMNLRELASFRTSIGAGTGPRSTLTSLTLKLLLHDMEVMHKVIAAPMFRYAMEVWYANLRSYNADMHPRAELAVPTEDLVKGWSAVNPPAATSRTKRGTLAAVGIAAERARLTLNTATLWTSRTN